MFYFPKLIFFLLCCTQHQELGCLSYKRFKNQFLVSFSVPAFFVYNLTWFQQSKALSAGCQKNAEGPSWLPAATQLVSAIPAVAANFAKNVDCGAAGLGWLQVQVLSLLQLPDGGGRYFQVLDLSLNLVISERDLCTGGLEVVAGGRICLVLEIPNRRPLSLN